MIGQDTKALTDRVIALKKAKERLEQERVALNTQKGMLESQSKEIIDEIVKLMPEVFEPVKDDVDALLKKVGEVIELRKDQLDKALTKYEGLLG